MRLDSQLILGIALGTALLTSPLAWADGGGVQCQSQSSGHAMSRHGGATHTTGSARMLRHLLKNKQELGLSDDQIVKLRTLALDSDRARIRAEADVMVSERELRALLWDEKAELAAIEAKVKEHEAFEATSRIIGIKARRDLNGVLTAEQRAKQKTLWEQRHRHRNQMMQSAGAESEHGADVSVDGITIEVSELENGLSAG